MSDAKRTEISKSYQPVESVPAVEPVPARMVQEPALGYSYHPVTESYHPNDGPAPTAQLKLPDCPPVAVRPAPPAATTPPSPTPKD